MKVDVELRLPSGGRAVVVLRDGVLDPHRAELVGESVRPVRLAYAAAHVAWCDSYRDAGPLLSREDLGEHVDWEATLGLRRRLDRLGFAVAEAMDTAQRFDIGWPLARRLIEECGALELQNGFVAGAGADQLAAVHGRTELVDAVVDQAHCIQSAGGEVILLPMVWLAQNAGGAADYVEVYGAIVRQLEGPVYVHWLGEMFHPGLRGYFPDDSFERVMALDPAVVRGAKLSLLDAAREVQLRRALLERDQIVLTGDDLHFADLIAGGGAGGDGGAAPAPIRHAQWGAREVPLGDFSHALLGCLDAVAEPAGLALQFLARGDTGRYLELMRPAEALSRAVFEAPTQHYKAGLAFLSWLNGEQDNAMLYGGEERMRDLEHYQRVAQLASDAGVLTNAELAAERLRSLEGE